MTTQESATEANQHDSGSIVVMKFGGTSVAEEAGRAALRTRVEAARAAGMAPVVVVSAMGRRGAPYATDTLLGLVGDHPGDAAEADLLASVGEVISAVVIASELRAAGIEARAFSGPDAGILTDDEPGGATIVEIHPDALLVALHRGVVPVVAGFQGLSTAGRVTTLGRGGSDTTACALGVALGAAEVEIYSDVDGVMTADPRTCDDALVLEVIGSDELFQMARHGSRVVHTPAAELALSTRLPVRVRGTFSDHPGTAVVSELRPSKLITAVTSHPQIARLQVELAAAEGSSEHMEAQTKTYRAMADAGISLDMFTPVGERLVFTVAQSDLVAAVRVLDRIGLAHETTTELAKVTLVGAGMHGVPGVMARTAEYLRRAGIDVLQAADSHTTISVLVSAGDEGAAVGALHDGFELGATPR